MRWIPVVLALAWGLNWPAVKIILGTVPPFLARGIGLGGGVLVLFALAAWQGRDLRPRRADAIPILIGGGFTVALFNFATAFAQLNTSTSRAAVLTFTMPMMNAALAALLLGERLGSAGAAALALGMAGVAVLAWPVLDGALHGASVAGLVFPLLAALVWALGSMVMKRWPMTGDRVVATAWQLAVGALAALAAAAVAGEAWPTAWPAAVIVAMGFHVLIATAVAYVLWYRLLGAVSATVAGLTTLAVPVVGVLGAMLLVGDRPGGLDLLGFAAVLGGAALAMRAMARR
ncbi:MAG: DMT family transporter [Burkholderiaceae bacterium]|nr:DMT family transporter [Burkholderiaceae bacterium]